MGKGSSRGIKWLKTDSSGILGDMTMGQHGAIPGYKQLHKRIFSRRHRRVIVG